MRNGGKKTAVRIRVKFIFSLPLMLGSLFKVIVRNDVHCAMTEYGRNCQQIISTNVENYQELFFLSDLFVMLTKKTCHLLNFDFMKHK